MGMQGAGSSAASEAARRRKGGRRRRRRSHGTVHAHAHPLRQKWPMRMRRRMTPAAAVPCRAGRRGAR